MKIDLKLSGMKEIKENIEKFEIKADKELVKIINRGCLLIASNAKRRVQRGPKSGIVYEKYRPRRTHRASAKGQAPATDTGNLVNNIDIEIKKRGLEGYVVSNAYYSKWLEHGTRKMGKRPFMYPAFRQEVPGIIKDLKAIGK